MKFNFAVFFAALVAVLAFGTASFAQETNSSQGIQPPPPMEHNTKRFDKAGQMHGHREDGYRGGMVRAFSELNLTDSQKQQVNSIVETNKTGTQAQRAELKQLMIARRSGTALTPEQDTRAQELSSQLRESNKKMHADLVAILTPEQQQQLRQKHDEMRQKMQERRQMKQQKSGEPAAPQNK